MSNLLLYLRTAFTALTALRNYPADRLFGDAIASAHADEDLAPDITDHLLKVEVEGDRIIFTNHRCHIEKRLDEMKVEIWDDDSEPRMTEVEAEI